MSDSIQLEIERPGKPPQTFEVPPGLYKIGSDEDCRIRLAHETVDPQHAILNVSENDMWIEDLHSDSGTFVDQQRISDRAALNPGQQIKLGPFSLRIIFHNAIADAAGKQPEKQTSAAEPPSPKPVSNTQPAPAETPAQHHAPDPAAVNRRRSIKQQIHRELLERMDIKRLTASRMQQDELRTKAMETITQIVEEVRDRLPPDVVPDELSREICDEALGLGPLESLLEDESVTEIMVNGPDRIYVERNGRLIRTNATFMDDASVLAVIERIVSPLGRRIDESQPYVDARLPDGSRVNAIIHPLSLSGPSLTIRKFSKIPLTDADLINYGTMTKEAADFLKMCVRLRKNIIVSGGTGSGKTTLLNVLSNYLPTDERIVTIEDAAELRLSQDHVIRLESRPANIEGRGAVAIRDLVRNALRMRPDRIVVGECRGGEALDMLQAMNTGHDGSLTTVHANTPRDVISRLETMVLMSGMDLPLRAIREQVAAAIDLIVHEARFSDGSRRITYVTEVCGQEGEQITMQDIFTFKQTGIDENGRVIGDFVPTGAVPTFMEEIEARGLQLDRSIFSPRHKNTNEE